MRADVENLTAGFHPADLFEELFIVEQQVGTALGHEKFDDLFVYDRDRMGHFAADDVADVRVVAFGTAVCDQREDHPESHLLGFRAGLPAAEEMDASRVEDARNHARFGLHAQTQVLHAVQYFGDRVAGAAHDLGVVERKPQFVDSGQRPDDPDSVAARLVVAQRVDFVQRLVDLGNVDRVDDRHQDLHQEPVCGVVCRGVRLRAAREIDDRQPPVTRPPNRVARLVKLHLRLASAGRR